MNYIITPQIIEVAGVVGTALFLLIFGLITSFFMLIKKSFKANRESQSAMLEIQNLQNENLQKFFNNFIDMINVQHTSTIAVLEEIKEKAGRTVLDKALLYDIYIQASSNHVNFKVIFARKILTVNNIEIREKTIKTNLDTKYREYTQKEICFFNKIYTKNGCFGAVFARWIDSIWEDYMQKVYKVFFSKDTVEQKLNDLRNLMDGALSDFWEKNIK